MWRDREKSRYTINKVPLTKSRLGCGLLLSPAINTDEHKGGYNLLQTTDLNLNVQAWFKRNVNLVICHVFSLPRAVLRGGYLTGGLELLKISI